MLGETTKPPKRFASSFSVHDPIKLGTPHFPRFPPLLCFQTNAPPEARAKLQERAVIFRLPLKGMRVSAAPEIGDHESGRVMAVGQEKAPVENSTGVRVRLCADAI